MRSQAKVIGVSTLLAALALCLLASSALAATGFLRSGEEIFAGPFFFDGDGQVHHNNRIAVEHSSGHVLKSDPVADEVVVYVPTGTGLEQIASLGSGQLADPFGIAIDQASGDVYVSDSANNRIVRYESDGQPTPAYTFDGSFTSPVQGTGAGEIADFKAPLAIDPASGKLLVADPGTDLVKRFLLDGSYDSFVLDGSGSPATFAGLQDLAVDSTGDLLVVDSEGGDPADGVPSRVERFSAGGAWEETLAPVVGAATLGVLPGDDSVIVSARQAAANDFARPVIARFNASGDRLADLPAPATLDYSTISGVATAPGAGNVVYVASDTSRGFFPGLLGSASIQSYEAVEVPDTVALVPSALTPTTATLRGEIDPGGVEGSYYFEYSVDGESWTATAEPLEPVDANGPIPVLAKVSGLTDDTEYRVRLIGKRGDAIAASPAVTFTTPDGDPPAAALDAPTGVTAAEATLNATVNPNGLATTVRFELGDGGSGSMTLPGPDGDPSIDDEVGSGTSDVSASALASGLEPNRQYPVRVTATNPVGSTVAEGTLTTAGEQAIASGTSAVEVTATTVRLKGTVDPRNTDTTYRFEYGPTTSYGSATPDATAASTLDPFGPDNAFDPATIARSVAVDVTGLVPATTYHYRLVADNGNGAPAESADGTFTTPQPPPLPTTGGATDVTSTSATLTGAVDTEGRAGSASFTVVQTNGTYANVTPPIDLSAAAGPQAVSTQLSDLPPGGSFELRLRATTDGGERYGDVVTFSTPARAPNVPPAQPGEGTGPPVSPPPPALGELVLLGAKVGGNKVTLRVQVPAAGKLTATGKHLANATKRATAPGTVKLTLRLTKAGRKALAASGPGRLTTTAKLAFTATGGEERGATRTITFERKASR